MQYDENLTVIGATPCGSEAEAVQFARVMAILKERWERIGPWCFVLLNHRFFHTAGHIMDVDSDWNGQIDILLVSTHKIAIYELKGFTARIVYGKTDESDWKIQRASSDKADMVPSYFLQASKQRAFLLRDFLPKFDERYPEYAHNHWVVDARVVLKPGSDLSGFFYRVPMTETTDKLQSEVLDRLSREDDKAFVRNAFSGIELSTGKLHRIKLPRDEYERLKRIYQQNDIRPRTQKWFRVITEDLILADLQDVGSDKFTLDRGGAHVMIEDLLSLTHSKQVSEDAIE